MDIQIIELIIFIFLIFLTGFLAAAEIAISSFGENKIEEMKERKETIALSFEKIQKDAKYFWDNSNFNYNMFDSFSDASISFRFNIA